MEYFREGWNVFDFLAVGLAFVPGLRENTTILRLARLARIFGSSTCCPMSGS